MTNDQPANPSTSNVAQIIHALAKATQDSLAKPDEQQWYPYAVYFEVDSWPQLARELLRQTHNWPALHAFAELPIFGDEHHPTDEQSKHMERLILELIEQTQASTLLPYWEMMCAITAHKWELEKQTQGDAAEPWAYASIFDVMWQNISTAPAGQKIPGDSLLNRGAALRECIGFQDIDKEMIALLEEAAKLPISVPFDSKTCEIILSSTY